MNTRYFVNTFKKFISFFCELFTLKKGLSILACVAAGAVSFLIFADMEVVNEIINVSSFADVVPLLLPFPSPALWHVFLSGCWLAIFVGLVYIHGTCLREKNKIKKDMPGAKLPPKEGIPHPELKLYIPHRTKGYIEMEFYSFGIYKERWDEMLAHNVNPALGINVHYLKQLENHIIRIHATNNEIKPKHGVLYDE